MISPFTHETGGTLVVPGSHRSTDNPSGQNGVDPLNPYPTDMQATGDAGSVLIFDSRTWHAAAPNETKNPRVSVVARYAPWWLNLDVLMPGFSGSDPHGGWDRETRERSAAGSTRSLRIAPGEGEPLVQTLGEVMRAQYSQLSSQWNLSGWLFTVTNMHGDPADRTRSPDHPKNRRASYPKPRQRGAHVLGVVVNNIQPSRGLGISANRGMGVSPMIRRLHNRTGETPVPSTD